MVARGTSNPRTENVSAWCYADSWGQPRGVRKRIAPPARARAAMLRESAREDGSKAAKMAADPMLVRSRVMMGGDQEAMGHTHTHNKK